MASIDEIFAKSGLPTKRKGDPVRDPNEVYKATKTSSANRSRHAHVDEEAGDDDTEAGPAAPPLDEDDDDYGPSAPPEDDEDENDDEEGRFFGGGISAAERRVLDYMDKRGEDLDDGVDEEIDLAWLKKTALAFEKKISRNAELRARYEAEPARFIDSEADLDAAIKALSILSENSQLYPNFARLGCVGSLVSLLAHENTDIALDAVEIIGELTDENVMAEEEDWVALVDALLEADLVGLLVSNFGRLDETQEADRDGVYHAMGVIENLCSKKEVADKIGAEESLVKWLLERAGRKETSVSQNKQYAAEVLAILAQASEKNRVRLAELDAVDQLLQLVATYRKRDPEKGGDEREYMENLFEALTSLVHEPVGKAKFVEAEGVELCLIMLKEGKLSKPAALRLLNHAAGAPAGAGVCQKIVDAGGLKATFTYFMKRPDKASIEHLVGIFASMLRLLPGESAERIRTLAKFVEKDYQKTAELIKLRKIYADEVRREDDRMDQKRKRLDREDWDLLEDEAFLGRLEAGLFVLQTIDVILAWLVAEDDGARKKIQGLLAEQGGLAAVNKTIQDQIKEINIDSHDGKETKEMLTTLAQFLQ
ncbi:Catenin-beta-like protein [Chaetomium sp. MPI-SDFR-AT-0129]|nr:Catenin-beta-like protein [Chaetomium sp. MPI-SDFR-AT-0129]